MGKRHISAAGIIGIGLAILAAGPAQAGTSATIEVPTDFVAGLSDTRDAGHYEVVGTGLHIYTDDSSSKAKVAEYVATKTPLASVGEPSLNYTATTGGTPGFQLYVDFDTNGSYDGILVGEPVYNGDWWLSNSAQQFVKDKAPSNTGGSGSANHGTLDQWRTAFPQATVTAFGFSLGSGVKGDGTLNAINFGDTHYTFTEPVVLTSKEECKDGGWATSTAPVYKNQGECVSAFAATKMKKTKAL
jgi:hypothetical protein